MENLFLKKSTVVYPNSRKCRIVVYMIIRDGGRHSKKEKSLSKLRLKFRELMRSENLVPHPFC
jgi:hypothetical protein